MAHKIVIGGWHLCLGKFSTSGDLNNTEIELRINWDGVDPAFKRQLVNLKLTELAIEEKMNGPVSTIRSLKRIFKVLRRIAGLPITIDEKRGILERRQSAEFVIPERQMFSLMNSSMGNVGRSSSIATNPKSASVTNLSLTFQALTFETQISLWLTTSILYRNTGQFEKAASSLQEAQNLADSLSRFQFRVHSSGSRLFNDSNPRSSWMMPSGGDISRGSNSRVGGTYPLEMSGGGWDSALPRNRQILADLALEVRKS